MAKIASLDRLSGMCVPYAVSRLIGCNTLQAVSRLTSMRDRLIGKNNPTLGWNRTLYIPVLKEGGVDLGNEVHMRLEGHPYCNYFKLSRAFATFPHLTQGTWLARGMKHLYIIQYPYIYDCQHPNGIHYMAMKRQWKVENVWFIRNRRIER